MDIAYHHGLERRYDGPIPPADPAVIPVPASARARLFERLAAEAVATAARRRAGLARNAALADARLGVLAHALATYRAHGIAWR